MRRNDALSHLATLADALEPDALETLVRIAERLAYGQQEYGRLDLATSTRDWIEEAAQEAMDLGVYLAFALIRAGRIPKQQRR